MNFSNEELLQEIERESKALSESLSLYSEAKIDGVRTVEHIEDSETEEAKKKNLENKSNVLLADMKKRLKDEDYIINGFGYHSKILYRLCTKFPFLGNTIGVPLMAITRAITANAISRKMRHEKLLKVYTSVKSDKAAVDAKIEQLEKLQKLSNEQKEQLVLLKKMSSELEFSMKRLEYNFKMSHIEGAKVSKKMKELTGSNSKKPKVYTV